MSLNHLSSQGAWADLKILPVIITKGVGVKKVKGRLGKEGRLSGLQLKVSLSGRLACRCFSATQPGNSQTKALELWKEGHTAHG